MCRTTATNAVDAGVSCLDEIKTQYESAASVVVRVNCRRAGHVGRIAKSLSLGPYGVVTVIPCIAAVV